MQYIKMGHMFQGKVLGSNHVLRFNDALAHLERKMKTDSILAMEKTGWGRIKMQKGLSLFGNADGDRLMNVFDCNPFNKHLQGPEQTAMEELDNALSQTQKPEQTAFKEISSQGYSYPIQKQRYKKESQIPSLTIYDIPKKQNSEISDKSVKSEEDLVTQYLLNDAIDQLEKGHPQAYNKLNPSSKQIQQRSKQIQQDDIMQQLDTAISQTHLPQPSIEDMQIASLAKYGKYNSWRGLAKQQGIEYETPTTDITTPKSIEGLNTYDVVTPYAQNTAEKIYGTIQKGKETIRTIAPEWYTKKEESKQATEAIKKQAREQAIKDITQLKAGQIYETEKEKYMKQKYPGYEEVLQQQAEKAGIIQTPYGLVFNPFVKGKSKKGTLNTVDNFLNTMRMKALSSQGPLQPRISGGTMMPQMPATDRFTGMMGFGGRTGGMGAIDTAYSMVKASTGSGFGEKVNMLMPSRPMSSMGSSFDNKVNMLTMRGGMQSFGGNAASFDERMMPRRPQPQYIESQQSMTPVYSQPEPQYVEPEPQRTVSEGTVISPYSKRPVRYTRGPYKKY